MNDGSIHLRIPKQVALCTICLLAGGMLFGVASAVADGLNSTQTVVGSDIIMPYDGYLMVDSAPLTGTRTIKFDLYQDATGGTAIWTETQTVNLYNGRFSVGLGSAASLTNTILDAEKLYLSMTVVEVDAQGNAIEVELSGRQAIEPAPFAAWSANSADFNVGGALSVAGNAGVTGNLGVTGTVSVTGTSTFTGDATFSNNATVTDTLTTNDFVVTATSQLGNGYASDNTYIKGRDNDGTNSAVTIQSASDQRMLLDGNEIDTIDTDLYLQNNSTNDVRVQNDLLVEGGIYNATVLDLADNSNILDVNLIRGYNDILFRGQQSSSSNDMKLTSGGDLEVYNDLTVSGSISGTLSSSCPGTPFAEDYVSGSNTRMCVYEMTTARNWPDSAARCYGNFNGAELCSYQQVRAMVSHGGMTFDGTERWLADVTLDDEALYTNRAVTSTGDGDIDNFEGDGDMDDTKRAFCCLRITN
jgi:hypothetical protein